MIITIEDLQKFTNVYPEDTNSQQGLFVESACNIIANYLHYEPEEKAYTFFIDGTGEKEIQVLAQPITEIKRIEVDGVIQEGCFFDRNCIFSSIPFPKGKRNIKVILTAGYKEIPAIIKLTALRIAGILQTESNNNIGINSKSFQDSGTRTFINTTNFDKYLLQIADYRI